VVVKGIQFQGLRAVGSPAELALRYEQQGADEIVILDVSATNEKRNTQIETVQSVRSKLSIPLTVGGGVRSIEDVLRLTGAGADRVSLNTAAVADPGIINDAADRFGTQCVVVALDAKSNGDSWQVVTHSGSQQTGLDVVDWAREIQDRGAGEILLTSFDQDGRRQGYDCELLQAVSSAVSIPIIASGGANDANDLFEGLNAGAAAVLIASILHDAVTTVENLKSELLELGACVRT
jgi:imidazoleglycerol phosphate synthase cyclase subunit